MTKWEYNLFPILLERDLVNIADAFKTLGDDGWELASSFEQGNLHCFVFKRPLITGKAGTWGR